MSRSIACFRPAIATRVAQLVSDFSRLTLTICMHCGGSRPFSRHSWISCSPAKLCQKHEHLSQNTFGVDCGSSVSSGPVAFLNEKSTVENKRTPVLQKVQHSFTYPTLKSMHHCPTMTGNSL